MSGSATIIADLKRLVSFATTSSDPAARPAIRACARWLAAHLEAIGLQRVQVMPTATHPVVYGEYISHPALPTVLFYGHYDVQPADPLNRWSSPPFQPVVQGDYLLGRGASDDKGQFFIHIKAVEQLLREKHPPGVNVKFLIEGAEEIGSAGLRDLILRNRYLLRCDVVVVSDTKMASLHTPAITYSLRGALNAEVVLQTAFKDLHSGTFGGAVPDAAALMGRLVHALHHPDHSIAIPGFYQNVREPDREERDYLKRNGPSDASFLADAAAVAWRVPGFSLYEQTTILPCVTVTGVTAGYQGAGVKNVVPSSATLKLNFRLVPDQRPGEIRQLFSQHLRNVLPPWVRFRLTYSSDANPVQVSRSHPYVTAAAQALQQVFGKTPTMLRSGGTIPAVDYLATLLSVPVVLMGFAQASDNMHAPDERFYLPNLFRGMETIRRFIGNLALMHLSSPNDTHRSPRKKIHHAGY